MSALLDAVQSLLGGGLSQARRLIRVHSAAVGSQSLAAERLDGFEAIGDGGFAFDLFALSPDAFIDLESLLGQPVLIELLTAQSLSALRPLHGIATQVERLGSNGGVARYRLRVEPWLSLLKLRRDAFIWQDKSVVEIVEDLFADYQNQGALVPAWRWDLADASVYPKYSLKTQYAETDFAFFERLLASEGLYYWFEHTGNAEAPTLGDHTLVIADHNEAFRDLGPVPFHRADATETRDSIQQWHAQARWTPHAVNLRSWDYRTLSARPVSASGTRPVAAPLDLAIDDAPGAYLYADSSQGQRLANVLVQAQQASMRTFEGIGTERRLAAGGRFSLTQHPSLDSAASDLERSFVVTHLHHEAHNNLSADLYGQIETLFGRLPKPSLSRSPKPAPGRKTDETPRTATAPTTDFYRNHFSAIPVTVPYRMATADGHGASLHPKPTVSGAQSAIVVGDAPVHTDRDHRIKVQFHWVRGSGSHSRLDHPSGDDNAPAGTASGTWVRVAVPQAGANFGTHQVPRVGQEVLVEFLEGDIDRPVVVGSLYNGRGARDAQGNTVGGGAGAATGNAAAWFAGSAGAFGHPAALSGLKSQSLSNSQDGSGGHNHLIFDDTPGEPRVQLGTTQAASALSLGHLKQQQDSARLSHRGHGAELTTQKAGAVRAGSGLLLTTEPGGGSLLQATRARASLQDAQNLMQALAETADAQNAKGAKDPAAKDLPAIAAGQATLDSLAGTSQGSGSAGGSGGAEGNDPDQGPAIAGGAGTVAAWTRPDLVLCSPDGIAALTPASHVVSAGNTASLVAGKDLNLATQGATVAAVASGIRLFTYGKAANPNKPNQETGIKFHAALGKVSLQAQSDAVQFAADKTVTLASTTQDVSLSANQHLLLTAKGAYLKIEGGNIELGAPGNVTFHAAQKNLSGPGNAATEKVTFPKGNLKGCAEKLLSAAGSGGTLA